MQKNYETAKGSPPLNNPPLSKGPANANIDKNIALAATGKGVVKGKNLRAKPICYIATCATCGEVQNIVCCQGKEPAWHKCTKCGALQPADAYRVSGFGWPPLLDAAEWHRAQHPGKVISYNPHR